jgi:ubiquinone/menaquinone biosynthesis C-methylase UbiE
MTIEFNYGMSNIVANNIYKYEVGDIDNALKSMDFTISYLNNELLENFFKQGMEFGIFGAINKYKPKIEEVNSFLRYPNENFINEYIKTAIDLNIIYEEEGILKLNNDLKIVIEHPEYDKFMEDYAISYDYLCKMSRYALIGYNHPKILLDFKKDVDIWDMILNTSYLKTCRNVVAEYLNLQNGDYILDVGCGSRSPEFYTSKILPKGVYTGIDISYKLLKIAETRTKRWNNGCISLKTMDFSDAIIKNKYDYVICTYTLKYVGNMEIYLKKMMDALRSGGKLFIAEEFFRDSTNVNTQLFEYYNKLNKYFKRYPSKKEIIDYIESQGYDFRHTSLSEGILIIEKK